APLSGAVVSATDGTNTFSSTTDSNGHYSILVPPGTYTVSAKANGRNCTPDGSQQVTVANGDDAVLDFCLSGDVNLVFAGDSFTDASGDGFISPNECVSLDVTIANPGCADANDVYGTLTTT